MTFCRSILSVCVIWAFFIQSAESQQQALRTVRRAVTGVARKIKNKSPHRYESPTVTQLTKEMDWLEHEIEKYGSIVPKRPDVWGQARLTRQRHEFEEEISSQFTATNFKQGLQGALRRSDQSFLGLALAVDSAAEGATAQTDVTTSFNNMISDAKSLGQVPDNTIPALKNNFGGKREYLTGTHD